MSDFFKAVRLTLVFCAFIAVSYVFVLWLFAKVAGPNGGNVELAVVDGKSVGAVRVGQAFSSDRYFWGRPSCAGDGYDAANSCGSNKGPTNPEYLAEVEARVDSFLVSHPYLDRADVPVDMVTASGSGLDPDISPKAAQAQVRRVALARGMTEERVADLVEDCTSAPLGGLLGPAKVNVLELNIKLDQVDVK